MINPRPKGQGHLFFKQTHGKFDSRIFKRNLDFDTSSNVLTRENIPKGSTHSKLSKLWNSVVTKATELKP